MTSLVLSRLLYNTQTWVRQLPAIKKINCVYMRVLRRILGDCRYGPCVFSDLEVRRQLRQPSIDCLLLRRRMHYLKRLVTCEHKSLIAVLALVHKGRRLPWVDLICKDMGLMYERMPSFREVLPAPKDDPFLWADFIKNEPLKWLQMVNAVSFFESQLDHQEAPQRDEISSLVHKCTQCDHGPCFATNKALLQHQRKKHGYKDPVCKYIDGSGVCPSCRTHFHTRLRCLAHVCDTRRVKCRDTILSGGFPTIPPSMLRDLDEQDQLARTSARKRGHTHPQAVMSARTCAGKRIGYVK